MAGFRSTSDRPDRATLFVDLLTSHQRELYGYINALMLGHHGAPDVLQETNLALWKHLDEYDLNRPFLAWAFGFAYHAVLAYRKKLTRSRLVFSDSTLDLINKAYCKEVAESDSRIAALQSCVEKLDPNGRQLIRERYMGRLSVQKMADQTGTTANQMSARLYRLRRSLERCVKAMLAKEANQ